MGNCKARRFSQREQHDVGCEPQQRGAELAQRCNEAALGLGAGAFALLAGIFLAVGIMLCPGVSGTALASEADGAAVSGDGAALAAGPLAQDGVSVIDDDLPPNIRLRATWNIGADPDHEDALTASIYFDDAPSEAYLVIAGEGDAKTFSSAEDVPWYGDDGRHVNYVIFEDGPEITCLDYWFCYFVGLMETPTIPDTVTSLGSTFLGCTSLVEAPLIPAGATNLDRTFYGCDALNTLPAGFAIPEGATTEAAFYVGDPYSPDNLRWTLCAQDDYDALCVAHDWEGDNRRLSADETVSWEIGSPTAGDVTATITPDGVLEVSGEGDVQQFGSDSEVPWYAQGFSSHITSATFAEGVTPHMLDYWFYDCPNLIFAPEIPGSVISLHLTFGYCSSMTLPAGYTLPDLVTDMSATFIGCSALTLPAGFTIPDAVCSLYETFYACTSLEYLPESFALPSQALSLDYAFAWSGLKSIPENLAMPDAVVSASYMFYYCTDLVSVGEGFEIGRNVTTIEQMFDYCSVLESLPARFTIPDSVVNMNRAFERCFALTELPEGFKIGANVEDMGYAFYNCSRLESLPAGFTIPDSVTDMSSAFASCTALAELPEGFTIGANVEDMSSAFSRCASITELPAGFAIPEGATAARAFYVEGSYSSSNPLYTPPAMTMTTTRSPPTAGHPTTENSSPRRPRSPSPCTAPMTIP